MEWLPLLILFCGYFAERVFGKAVKNVLFQGKVGRNAMPVPEKNSLFYLLGIFCCIAGIIFHNAYFYSFPFDGTILFGVFVVGFLLFLNTSVYKNFSRKAFQKALQGKEEGEIIKDVRELETYIVSDLSLDTESRYSSVLVVSAALLIETVVAPIFLFLVGGYALFGCYLFLYLLLAVFRVENRLLREFYYGLLFLPGIFSVVLFAFTAFAAGRSFNKVIRAGFLKIGDAFRGYDHLLLLNVTAMVAVLETKLELRYGGETHQFDFGDEMLSQRTFVLTQRLIGIQKFMTYVFSYYLYVVL